MKILENILKFFSENKKNIFYILLFSVFLLYVNDFALAEDPGTTGSKQNDWLINALNLFLGMVGSILALITMLIGLFLRPEWTSGSVIGLDTQLKAMWIMISNIVYFVFAGIFVSIAFMNIIGGGGNNYELKKALPKFIVGVLIVPFSWFFVQFILSLSSILTVAILSLPYNSFPDMKIGEVKMSVCKQGYKINLSATGSNIISCEGGGEPQTESLNNLIRAEDNGGLYQIMMIYTFGVMKLDVKGKLYSEELSRGITDISKLSAKAIFDLVFIVVYLILLVALFLAFMIRGITLWFYIMFSPVFGLLYFFSKGKDGMGEGAVKKFNITEFIALAFVPVYVAGALVFGLIFLHTASKGLEVSGTISADKLLEIKEGQLKIKGGVPLTFDAVLTKGPDFEIFKGFNSIIGTMILQLLGIAVLWIAVMAAVKQSSVTANITQPIADFGSQIGKLMSKAPTYAPIFPGGQSIQSLSRAGNTLTNIPDNIMAKRAEPLQQKLNKVFRVDTIPYGTIQELKTKMSDGITEAELPEIQSELIRLAEEYGTKSSQYQGLLQSFNKSLNDIRTNSSVKKLHQGDAKLFDNSGVLTEEGLKILYNDVNRPNNPVNNDRKQWAISVINGGVINSGSTGSTPLSGTSSIPSTIVTKKVDNTKSDSNINILIHQYGINNLSKDNSPLKIDIQHDGRLISKIDSVANAFRNKGYSNKYTREDFRKLLHDIGIKNDTEQTNIINRLGDSFFIKS